MLKNKWARFFFIVFDSLVVLVLLYILVLLPWHLRYGATDGEVARPMPGDEIVASPDMGSTHAITINASAAQVWPWIIQMGQGRGGLYSYEGLENLAGCDIHNADRILAQFQTFNVGDKMRLGPPGFPFFNVMAVDPGKSLVLGGMDPQTQKGSTWVFMIEPVTANSSRLIIRSRGSYVAGAGNFIIWRVITEPLSFFMEQKMMRGIQQRAEGQPVSWW